MQMFSNTMEIDCSLEEFARVLVANGYINDDSCFIDADIPSMLSAFETADMLDCPNSFPDISYNSVDLSRTLEMAQVASLSLLESSLSENLTHSKNSALDFHSSASEDLCIANSILNESLHNTTSSSHCKSNKCSKDANLDNISQRNFNNFDSKENKDVRHCNLQVNNKLLPHSTVTSLESSSYNHHSHYQITQSSDLCPSSFPDQVSVSSISSIEHGSATAEQDSTKSIPLRTKQKRKRRCKGYSKPAKSKKKKRQAVTDDTKPQPKPKKLKTPKDVVHYDRAVKEENILSHSEDTPQEDSGFESGDKKMSETAGSIINSSSENVSARPESDSVALVESNKSLRRSSRTTRNTENYNFRLTSLVKRVETERRQQEPRPTKDKTKPPPLSKYRRRTANARERDRMKEINDAFDTLKSALPSIERDDGKQKITKFTILKHALNYIASLRDILGLETVSCSHDDDASSDFSSVRPASATSFGGEDSCSSSTSGHSMPKAANNEFTSRSLTANHASVHYQVGTTNVLPQQIPLASSL